MSSRDVSELAGYLGCGSLAIAERVNSKKPFQIAIFSIAD
jgi:hypothetical protein